MPKVITLEKTKELLGASPPSDADITRKIPVIDAKVKLITNNRYNNQVIGSVTSGSTIVELISIYNGTYGWYYFNQPNTLGINNQWTIETMQEYLEIGTLISGDGIPSLAAEILKMEEHLAQARKSFTNNRDGSYCRDELRMVVAMGMRCMKNHGTTKREEQLKRIWQQ